MVSISKRTKKHKDGFVLKSDNSQPSTTMVPGAQKLEDRSILCSLQFKGTGITLAKKGTLYDYTAEVVGPDSLRTFGRDSTAGGRNFDTHCTMAKVTFSMQSVSNISVCHAQPVFEMSDPTHVKYTDTCKNTTEKREQGILCDFEYFKAFFEDSEQ